MKPNSDKWLREKAKIEDENLVSVGGLVSRLEDHGIFWPKERRLFVRIGMESYVKLVEDKVWMVYDIYNQLGAFCFLNDVRGLDAENAKRLLNAWNNCKPFRVEPAFEDLIIDPE